MKDLRPFAFAGLWEFTRIGGDDILSATIIVGPPNPVVAPIHNRMPMILEPAQYDAWLDPETPADDLRAVLKPYDETLMKAYEVSRIVNSVKNDTEECIEPVELPGS